MLNKSSICNTLCNEDAEHVGNRLTYEADLPARSGLGTSSPLLLNA
jgi:galactokinase/mevalonate kinase-like predicted kinase